MEPVLTYRGAVYPWHCDQVGHMNIMWYAGKFDEASWNLLLQLGLTPSYLRDNFFGIAALTQETAFKRELLAGDVIDITSRVSTVAEKTLCFVHTMYQGESNEIAASCTLTVVHMDRRARKSRPFPQAIREYAEKLAGLV